MTNKKKKKKDFKYWVGKAHLWLGLTSGLIVFLLGITGCIFVFSEEITTALRKDVIYVENTGHRLPSNVLWQNAQKALGDKKPVNSMTLYKDSTKAAHFYSYGSHEGSIWALKNLDYYNSVYVNPYTGKVLAVYNEKADFFYIIKMLHWSLLLETSIGQPITGYATLIFVVMLISGIILWWPKNKAARKQRVWFRWKKDTKWRRKNYDLHNILGFYISVIAIIVAFTGMVFSFTWFQSIVYVAGSGSITPPVGIEGKSVITPGDKDIAFNTACESAMKRHTDAESYGIYKPADSLAPIDIYSNLHAGTYYASHHVQYDQYNGKFLAEKKYSEQNFGEKLVGANYDIHVGAILGIPGKVIAFIVSFVAGMLPITGFMIWWGRNKKETKKPLPQKAKIG